MGIFKGSGFGMTSEGVKERRKIAGNCADTRTASGKISYWVSKPCLGAEAQEMIVCGTEESQGKKEHYVPAGI